MSLRGVLKKAAISAFKAFDDVPEFATYRRKSVDYSTGEVVETNSDVTVQGVFTRFELVEIDKVVVQNSDVKMIVRVGSGINELPYPPNPATDIVVRDGKQYNVINYKTEPSETIYIVQLRTT